MARPRVIVIGGGAAGLAAAARLVRRADVVLVEARDRLGGRIDTRTDPVLGIALEHGAEFVHGHPAREEDLARRARARIRAVPDHHLRRTGGRASDAARTFSRAQELLAQGRRDDEPFAAVLRRARRARRASPDAVAMADGFVRGFYLADPRTASARALAEMTRGLDEVGGDVTSRVEGGYRRVLEPLVRALRAAPTEVRLSTLVREVRWREGRVEIRARGRAGGRLAPIRGDRVIVTLPPPLLAELRLRPALPEKRRAAAALPMGPIVKVLLRFRRPLWARSGPRALAFLHVPRAAIPVFWTLAPLDAPVLVGWAGGPDFAGEATAGGLAGTVEGALRSGERAAREVLSSLRVRG
jgi:monoamine oxidase